MSCEICQTKNETVLKQLENYATARRLGTFTFCTAKLHNRPSLLQVKLGGFYFFSRVTACMVE